MIVDDWEFTVVIENHYFSSLGNNCLLVYVCIQVCVCYLHLSTAPASNKFAVENMPE